MDDRRAELALWRSEIADQPFRTVVLKIAGALASSFGYDGSVQISRRDLAAVAGLSIDTVKRVIPELVDTGWLEVETSSDGALTERNSYTFRFPEPRTEVTTDGDDDPLTDPDE